MSDFLLELGKNKNARKVIQGLGLPLPMPQALERSKQPWEERPLFDRQVAVGVGPRPELEGVIAETLARAGADPHLAGGDAELYRAPGEAYGRPARPLPTPIPERFLASALVFDGSGIASPAELASVYAFFHPLVGRVGRSGRAIVLARPVEEASTPAAAASQRALEGFVRSLARELGRRGATAHVVYVARGAEARVPALLRFLLSSRSAFLSGQPFFVSRLAAEGPGTDREVPYVRPLEKKVALVTGAARGIGAETARLLAAEGASVVCLDRPEDDGPLSQVAREIGGSVLAVDVTAADAPEKIASALRSEHGGVDVVVHNAGITRDKTLAKMSEDKWRQAIDVNLDAVVRIDDALIGGGVLRDHGRIVCLSSVAGIAGNMGQTNYAASKAGIVGYVEKRALELAPRGIAVNAIAPGFIETRLTRAIPVMIREAGRRLSNLGQGGEPEDIGQLVTFLASPGSQGLAGQIIRACGGAFIGA